jgi:hypothetical protein
MLTLKKNTKLGKGLIHHCTCIKLNLIDNFNISTLNKKKYAFLHAFNTTPLWSEKKIGSREPVACCHSPEMLGIKMLSFERKLQEQT